MKIVQYILSLGVGGAEAVVKEYAIELQKLGHTVEVVTLLPKTNSINEQQLEEHGIRVRSVYDEIYGFQSTNIVVRALRKPLRASKTSQWLLRYIKENKPDVIHMHLSLEEFVLPIADKIKNVKLVYTCHNEAYYYFGEEHMKATNSVKYLIDNNKMRLVALHNQMAMELNEIFEINNTVVLNNPINLQKYIDARSARQAKRKELGIPEDAFIVGHIGRFTYQKNHEKLIDVFYEVSKKNKDAFLLMVGDGELRCGIEERMKTLGVDDRYMILSNRKDIPELLSTMDVFVFPSRYEGLGIALVEAQASGLKCIVSDKIPKQAVLSNEVCVLRNEDQAELWSEKVLERVLSSREYEKLKEFDIVNVVERLQEIYRQ